jgi:hypothetical protein
MIRRFENKHGTKDILGFLGRLFGLDGGNGHDLCLFAMVDVVAADQGDSCTLPYNNGIPASSKPGEAF